MSAGGPLVRGRELYIDATKVEANADVDTLAPRFAVEAHLDQLFAEPPRVAADGEITNGLPDTTVTSPTPIRLPINSAFDGVARARHDWLAALGRSDRSIVGGPYQRTADFRVSTTDSDASPMHTGDGRTRLGDQDHYVVDGGRARIIPAVLVAPAEVQENQQALDLLWHARFRWRLHPRHVTGDTKYGSAENIVALEDQQVRDYVP